MKRVALSWSSGKDSAWPLHLLKRMPGIEVVALITNFNCAADHVAMHAVRRRLVEAQADRAGLPLWPVELPWPCPNAVYEDLISAICRRAIAQNHRRDCIRRSVPGGHSPVPRESTASHWAGAPFPNLEPANPRSRSRHDSRRAKSDDHMR
jgi:hypothetical protein